MAKAIREGVQYYNNHMEQNSSEGDDSDTKMSQDSDDTGKESPQLSTAGILWLTYLIHVDIHKCKTSLPSYSLVEVYARSMPLIKNFISC